MKLLTVIDPIETLNPKKDSSILMMQAAETLGFELYVTTIDSLNAKKEKAFAKVLKVTTSTNNNSWYELLGKETKNLNEFKVILMRKDPPFNQQYIYSTYLLELAECEGVIVSNKPQGLRDANEKAFIMQFPNAITDTLISSNLETLKAFHHQHKPTIAKPLDGMGGRSIFYLNEQSDNLNVVFETLTEQFKTPIMLQRYIPEVKEKGDKRVLIVGDKIYPYALTRIPGSDDIRGNLAQGATGKVVPITEHDKKLCENLIPKLQQKGLHLVGVDILGDYISEINVTSPTCLKEIEHETRLTIAKDYIEYLLKIIAKA